MSKSDVTIAKRKRLLRQGLCPIHGEYLKEVRCVEFGKIAYFCQERACRFFRFEFIEGQPIAVPSEFVALFDPNLPDPEINGVSIRKKGPRSRWSRVWLKTNGRCFYCGRSMTLDETTVDHFIASSTGGGGKPENLVPACASCNCAKNNRTLEEFRFAIQMKAFAAKTGVAFSLAQYAYLKHVGKDIGLPTFRFWFELQGLQQPNPLRTSEPTNSLEHKGGSNGESS